jgi:hypothetical protein
MYSAESMERSSKYKRWLKSLYSIIESLLNLSYNKYNQHTIYIKNYEESISYIFSLIPLKYLKRLTQKVRGVHTLSVTNISATCIQD